MNWMRKKRKVVVFCLSAIVVLYAIYDAREKSKINAMTQDILNTMKYAQSLRAKGEIGSGSTVLISSFDNKIITDVTKTGTISMNGQGFDGALTMTLPDIGEDECAVVANYFPHTMATCYDDKLVLADF
jgi:hypothetical protein